MRQRKHDAAYIKCEERQRRAAQAAQSAAAQLALPMATVPNDSKPVAKRKALRKSTAQHGTAQWVKTSCTKDKECREAALNKGRKQQRSDARAERRAATLQPSHAQASTAQLDNTKNGAEAEACMEVDQLIQPCLQTPPLAHEEAPKAAGTGAKRPVLSKRTGKHAKAQWQGSISKKQKAMRETALHASRSQLRSHAQAKRRSSALEATPPLATEKQQPGSTADTDYARQQPATHAGGVTCERAAKRKRSLQSEEEGGACKHAKALHCAVLVDQTQAMLNSAATVDPASGQQTGLTTSAEHMAAHRDGLAAAPLETVQQDTSKPVDCAASGAVKQQHACRVGAPDARHATHAAQRHKHMTHGWLRDHLPAIAKKLQKSTKSAAARRAGHEVKERAILLMKDSDSLWMGGIEERVIRSEQQLNCWQLARYAVLANATGEGAGASEDADTDAAAFEDAVLPLLQKRDVLKRGLFYNKQSSALQHMDCTAHGVLGAQLVAYLAIHLTTLAVIVDLLICLLDSDIVQLHAVQIRASANDLACCATVHQHTS